MIEKKQNGNKTKGSEILQFFFMVIVLFVFWLLLSGIFELQMILIGLITSIVVALITRPLVQMHSPRTPANIYLIFKIPFHKFLVYCLWLFVEIIKASISVMLLILNPKMPIDPAIVTFKNDYDNPLSIVTLGNSITLTPGTITIAVEDGVFHVHAITKQAGLETALPGGEDTEMAAKIRKLFEVKGKQEDNSSQ